MADRYPTPVFLDATVLSNFASAGGTSFLTSLLEAAVVVPAVRDEVERGRIDRSTADDWLDTWREQRGYYAPVESVGDLLDD